MARHGMAETVAAVGTVRQQPIQAAFEELDMAVGVLAEQLSALADRISPVTFKSDAPRAAKDARCDTAGSPVLEGLRRIRTRIDELTERARDLRESVQL